MAQTQTNSDTSTLGDPETAASWLGHPIVKLAAERAPDLSARSLLTSMSSLMNELEDRFPNMSFDEILGASESDLQPDLMAQHMLGAGVDPDDVFIVTGYRSQKGPEPDRLDPTSPTTEAEQRIYEIADQIVAGADRAALTERYGKNLVMRAGSFVAPMSENQSDICRMLLEPGATFNRVSRARGERRQTAMYAWRKMRYHRTRHLHEWADQ